MPRDPRRTLSDLRNADGGFGPLPGASSEPEATAVAALALDDDRARSWLAANQRADGSYSVDVGPYVNDSATALGALALGPGAGRDRALDHVEETRARHVDSSDAIPIDPSAVGWAWATGTASWVEPTARALWALRVMRPTSPHITDAVALLRDRECVEGGWNYGNRIVLGEALPPFAQTTAIALVGLLGLDAELEERGLTTLARLWRIESRGGLTLATSVLAFRAHGRTTEAAAAAHVLRSLVDETGLLGDVTALAWAALALAERSVGVDA
jgi:hypothetical protein